MTSLTPAGMSNDNDHDAEPPARLQGGNTADSMGAQCVRALFAAHAVRPRQYAGLVSEILALSPSQGRRKADSAPWTLEELNQVADRYGESLTDVVARCFDAPWESGMFLVGNVRIPCRFRIGAQLATVGNVGLVAHKGPDDEWAVALAATLNIDPTRRDYEVKRLLVSDDDTRALSRSHRKIAILEDDAPLAHDVGEYLKNDGFNVRVYTSLRELETADSTEAFDGYVLDWSIGSVSSRRFIESVRARDPLIPIIVLSGEESAQGDVADAYGKLDFTFLRKPLMMQILAAQLHKAFVQQPADPGTTS